MFEPFSTYQWAKTIDTSEKVYIGSAVFSDIDRLTNIRLCMYCHGAMKKSSFKINVYGNSARTALCFSSSRLLFKDDNYLGLFRFDFNDENITIGKTYYLELEPVSYARNAEIKYAAILSNPWAPVKNSFYIETYGKQF